MACDPVRGEGSALTLLVARVVADDHHAAVATDDLALVADLLDARLNLHEILFRVTIPCRDLDGFLRARKAL